MPLTRALLSGMIAAATVSASVLTMASCTETSSSSTVDVSGAYVATIQWFVAQVGPNPDPEAEQLTVFVERRGEGTEFDLSMQADVVDKASGFANVKFIDDRAEALATDDGELRWDGILLALGPAVVSDNGEASIDADLVAADSSTESWRLVLRATGDVWVVRDEPIRIAL